MRVKFKDWRPQADAKDIVDKANAIIEDYIEQGLKLTLRQLYYQFVARDWLVNSQKSYSRLGDIVSNARLAGMIDWDAIEDRTRNLEQVSRWDSPSHALLSIAQQFRSDLWEGQDYRVECWVEKEALAGVIEQICVPWRVPYLACRGYTSQSELFDSGHRRYREIIDDGQTPVILHLGDHDPSGIDMTRDITERMSLFVGSESEFIVERIALNMDQVKKHNPPPNPAKTTDSRFESYMAIHGDKSWELDALNPAVLKDLIVGRIKHYLDMEKWSAQVKLEKADRADLEKVSEEYPKVKKFLKTLDSEEEDDEA